MVFVMDEVNPSSDNEGRPRNLDLVGQDSYSSSPMYQRQRLAFLPYASNHKQKPSTCQVTARKSFVTRLTKEIVETYQTCNPDFKYSEKLKLKRFLTTPSIGVLNDGYDNANSDLILTVNCALVNPTTQRRYVVKEMLGHGTFGQVAKCWVNETNSYLAVKVIKNQPAYYQQALVEVTILKTLNKKYDPDDKHHIVRIYDHFVHQRHLCIAFELLDTNLYELIKLNNFRGLSLSIVQLFSKQILRGLALLKDAGIIHCDLKPENILLCTSVKTAAVKIIDFGSACMEDQTVYSYIQSRYYRSPEVLLGYQYTTAIDMWSFGCIVAELFIGLPLFAGASEFDLLKRMVQLLGGRPPDYLLKEAKNTSKFFKCVGSVHRIGEVSSAYEVLSKEEYEAREKKKPTMGKDYFLQQSLEEIVTRYPYRTNLSKEDIAKEGQIRLALLDFLRGLVEFDPAKRWSPFQASKHPFVTGEPFTCPYKPPSEIPCMPVSRNAKVDHHPGGGHWFAAGLSPNMPGRNRASFYNSPHLQLNPYGHPNSYGSIGSQGSYNEAIGLGSSYGSYGDNNVSFAYFSPVGPSAMNHHHVQSGVAALGSSPDTRRMINQFPHGSCLGMSPSAASFAPLPLGTSPSQFTPPSSYSQVMSCPNHGPTSPARGNYHGSPLGKAAAFSQYNRRKGHDTSSVQYWQRQGVNGASGSNTEVNSATITGSPVHLQLSSNANDWKQQPEGIGNSSATPSSFSHGSSMQSVQTVQAANENREASSSLLDPGNWDPNYSDELLLQDDGLDVNQTAHDFGKALNLGPSSLAFTNTTAGLGRFGQGSYSGPSLAMQRTNGSLQTFSYGEVGGSTSSYDPYAGHYRHVSNPAQFSPQFTQNSQIRMALQPNQRFSQANTAANHGVHAAFNPGGFSSRGPRSPGSGSFNNEPFWGGRRADHPIAHLPPTARGRKDIGRIS
ncbi:unnamed protein product [Rhodiola kirilowii]